MGVLLTHVSECHISEHVELTRTVHAVSESKNIGLYKRGFREHCSLPHCYVSKRSFLGPEFAKIAFGGRAPPGPTGGAYSAPQTYSGIQGTYF